MSEISDQIRDVQARIELAALKAGRDPASVTLVAVTKRVSIERIVEAYGAGLRNFGESYLQEGISKVVSPELSALPDIKWHFIGHLQTNKARDVEAHFGLIHSVDSYRLAVELGRRAAATGRIASVLLEVKLDSVETKFGFAPERVIEEALGVSELPGIRLAGLMGIAPYATAAKAGARGEASRPAFRRLNQLFCRLPETCRQTLSMGMTGDFEVAIEEGATLVRIGTGLFGHRT